MKHYWTIRVLTSPTWENGSWHYNGVPLVSSTLEYGDSPVRDKKSRLDMIKELCEAGVDFTVTLHTLNRKSLR